MKAWVVATVVLFVPILASAQSVELSPPSSRSESESGLIEKIKQRTYEEDTRITDLQIRADAGSLSRYSGKFTLGYSGPGLTDLSRPYAPNPDGRSGDFRNNISGLIGVRYRITPNDALYFSGGIKENFVGDVGSNQDINDPGVSYDHTYLITPAVQARTAVTAVAVTNSFYRKLGETNGFIASQTMKWHVGATNWILGFEVAVNGYFFQRSYQPSDKNATDYYSNLIPSLEYKLLHNLNFNTSFLQRLGHYRSQTVWSTIDSSEYSSERIGVGWAITRDIYVNPFVNVYPAHLAWDTSAIAMNTVFSVF